MEGSKIKFLSPSYLRCQGKGELSACLITRPSCMHLPRYSSPPRLQPSLFTQVSRGTLPTKRGSPIPSPPRQKGAISSSERVGKEPRLLRKKTRPPPLPSFPTDQSGGGGPPPPLRGRGGACRCHHFSSQASAARRKET